jgi:hypothetical protein
VPTERPPFCSVISDSRTEHSPDVPGTVTRHGWIDVGHRQIFAAVDSPTSGLARGAVILCQPLLADRYAAHPTFRRLSLLLARQGMVAVRFDHSSMGDSAGQPSELEDVATLEGDIGGLMAVRSAGALSCTTSMFCAQRQGRRRSLVSGFVPATTTLLELRADIGLSAFSRSISSWTTGSLPPARRLRARAVGSLSRTAPGSGVRTALDGGSVPSRDSGVTTDRSDGQATREARRSSSSNDA